MIVDDKEKEVDVLRNALWKSCVPFLYFDGEIDNLPPEPIVGVRLLFLDIDIGNRAAGPSNMASSLAALVRKILGDKPGPYFIVFWTGHP
ncbi:MAG: hypothetical protein WAZ31_09695, partial [Rectinemataceae bacterium]